jgi:hypothetical protein
MFGIDPEKIMAGLMKSMGVSPEDFVRFITDIQTELREMRADRLAFKPASIRVVQDMTARMDRIEAKQQCIFDLCQAIGRAYITDPVLLEELNRERKNAN